VGERHQGCRRAFLNREYKGEAVDGLRIAMQGETRYLVIPTPDRFVETIFRPEEVEVLADSQEQQPGDSE